MTDKKFEALDADQLESVSGGVGTHFGIPMYNTGDRVQYNHEICSVLGSFQINNTYEYTLEGVYTKQVYNKVPQDCIHKA